MSTPGTTTATRSSDDLRIAFFGTPQFAVAILDELEKAGMRPAIVITAPDKPKGRKLVITPPPVKVWAQHRAIGVLQPAKLDAELAHQLSAARCQLFIVAAYGLLISQEILDLPAHGTLNIHPSLLPLYRGSSPIEGQILGGDEVVGVTIMLLDAGMDHGPILAQEALPMPEPLPRGSELEMMLAHAGGRLLAETIADWVAGAIAPQDQDHHQATFTKKIHKEDGLLDLAGDPVRNFRKIRAYDPWPGTYFFVERDNRKTRILVKDAELHDNSLIITRVIPEGKSEMAYADFMRTGA